ncbi:MAG: F0F1 ATP synthase subunit B [Actinomycetota bacterium]|nr:F0F1 ATP synthase subunit B [Actinomycetota bacterium]
MGLFANTLLWAATEGGEEPSGTALILPAIEELLWGAIAFAVVFFVLNRFAFPALRKAVEEREQRIQNDLEGAERAKAEAEAERRQYQQQIADARSEANRIIEEARQSAERVRADLVAKAEADAAQIVARAQEQLEAERNRTVQELQSQVAQLSIELAEKVVNRSLDRDVHRELVDAYIREVSTMPAGTQN